MEIPDNLMPIYRRLVWDIARHEDLLDPATQARFHLNPASSEVTEMEHDAADSRLMAIAPLLFPIHVESALAAQAINTAILNSHLPVDAEPMDPDALTPLVALASASIIAGLVNAGLLVANYRPEDSDA